MLAEIFSDYFAQKENYLTRIDTRIKMIFVFGVIMLILFLQDHRLAIITILLSLILLISIKIPLKIILFRLSAPLGIAIMILFIHTFSFGSTPLFRLPIFGYNLIGYKEGLSHGLMILEKVIGCTSLILLLSMTTPVNAIISAARWFKIPRIWIEVATIAYRYIFVLIEDAATIRDAQMVRLGYTTLRRSIRSSAELIGSLLIRAYDRSIVTYEAMQLRGYLKDRPYYQDR